MLKKLTLLGIYLRSTACFRIQNFLGGIKPPEEKTGRLEEVLDDQGG